MRTISTKLFLIFSLSIAAFVLCNVILNSLLLEKYYVYRNKTIFEQTFRDIDALYQIQPQKIEDYLKELDRTDGITSTISDTNLNVIYSSLSSRNSDAAGRLPGAAEKMIRDNEKGSLHSSMYSIIEGPDNQNRQIAYIATLSNGELLFLRKPMKGIIESSAIATQFFILTGILLMFIGGIAIYIFSRRITAPVIEMSKVAQSLANLDFSRRVNTSSGDEIGILGSSINVMSDKLSASIDSLREDVIRRKVLVRNISHELKTPIGIIKGYAEGLKFGLAENSSKKEAYCNVIAAECDRMDQMIKELLNLSLLESGTYQKTCTRFRADELIAKVVDRFKPIIDENCIRLDLEIENDLWLNADYGLIEQAFTNFITNALDHIDDKKRLKIKAGRTDAYISFTVFNSGKPIASEDIEHIWDVFYKIDKARTRKYGGYGIGLSIVKMIAEVHGGVCGFKNAEDGVVFWLTIPGE